MALVQVDPEILLPLIRGYASKKATASYLKSVRIGMSKREIPPTAVEIAAKAGAEEFWQAIETTLGLNK